MKASTPGARNLRAVMRRYSKMPAPGFPDASDPVAVLVQSFFLWEATTDEAIAAYQAMKRRFVDYNELRVSLPHEIVATLGMSDRQAHDRCHRLRAVLTDVFKREHAVSLQRLSQLGKRELRKYLDELEGMVPFVASRLALLCFDSHSIPVDDRLRARLIDAAIADPGMDLNELSVWLARHVRASHGPRMHYALQAWCDQAARKLPARNGARRSTTKRETGSRALARAGTRTRKA